MPEHRDKYYYLAKKERYRSRAAFKLLELQTRFHLLKEGQSILEIGAAPGGWTQVISSITKSRIVSVDITKMEPIEGTIYIKGKVGDKGLRERLKSEMERNGIDGFNGILSDAMSHTTGSGDIDHSSSYLICQGVMEIAKHMLREGGFVVVKQFQGDLTTSFVNSWKAIFESAKITTVAASRESSREIYIVFQGFRGIV